MGKLSGVSLLFGPFPGIAQIDIVVDHHLPAGPNRLPRPTAVLRPEKPGQEQLVSCRSHTTITACSQPEKRNNKLFSDEQFQELSLSLSEEEQYFDTDNLISNERPYQHLIPAIKDRLPWGGAYLGVGPDQNFTYIAGTRPSIAFIIDIRRQNLLQHLYFKELFERARNRVEFLSLLLSRPTQTELSRRGLNAAGLVEIFLGLPADRSLTDRTVSVVFSSLRRRFPAMIQEADRPFLDQMAGTFRQEGPRLRFQSHRRRPRFFYPPGHE